MTEQNPFRKFWLAGYQRLVPITPPDAQVSEKSTLFKRRGALGKAVGIRGNDGLWRGFDWLKSTTTADDLDAWYAMGAGVGIRTGDGLVALDIDTLNAELAERAESLARATLGPAPVRFGRAPKRLLLYRTEPGVPYQRVIFDDGLEHKPGAEARIELLTDDRQFVAHGIHPATGQPYKWVGLCELNDLATVTPEAFRAYFDLLASLLPAAKKETQAAPSDRNVDQNSLRADLETVRKAVDALPNTTALFPTYDDYVRVGYAIKGACLDAPAEGLQLFQQWAAKWEGGNDPERVEADWNRMKPPFEIGSAWLFEKADQLSGGQFQHAEAWFDVQPETELNPFEEQERKAGSTAQQVEPIKWLRPSDWTGKEPPEREWEVEGWIPRREVTLLYGDGGIGKTLLIHQYATAAAAGVDWLGQKTRKARVMCFFCEDGEDELHRRQLDICTALGVTLADVDNDLRIASRKYMDNLLAIWNRNTTAMQRTAVWEQLVADIKSFGATVFIVDTLADTFGGSEIDRSQVNSFIKSCLGAIVAETGASGIALGHPSVAGKAEGRSGSTAWSNAARSRIFLRYPKGTEKGNVRELEGMKLNYGPKGALLKLKWNRGAFDVLAGSRPEIELNAFKEGAGESAALPTVESANEAAVLQALVEAQAAETALNLTKNSTAYAPRVLKRQWPEYLGDVSPEDVESALVALEKRGAIKAGEVGRRSDRKPIFGYAVVRSVLEGGQTPSGTTDNLSDRDGVFGS